MARLTIIDHASKQALDWIHEIQAEMHLPQEQSAYAALRAVLHVLRDRLPVKEAADLGGQLPTLVRGIYYEGWSPSGKPDKLRNETDLMQKVIDTMQDHAEVNAGGAIRSVFALLDRHISHGEIDDVISVLPIPLRAFWPEAAVARAGGVRKAG
jgi:uncharacterized protein (DUF2267 family)